MYPKDKCLHQLFEAQVERIPDALAVGFRKEHRTYLELNRRANQVARRLQQLGVGPEVLVGICVDRSLEMVIGLLGILKAGGAYVPLEPSYPKERLAFMLEDTHVPVVLTQSKLLSQLPEMTADGRPTKTRSPVTGPRSFETGDGPRSVVCLDTDWETITQENRDNLPHETGLNNLAYVIYTFGSTPKPRGVEVTHEALVNFACWAVDRYGLGPGDRVLQLSSIGFDAVVAEVFPSLTKGAALVICTHDMIQSVPTFLKRCEDLQVTVLNLPTNYWHEIMKEIDGRGLVLPNSLGLLIIRGDRVLPDRLREWRKQAGTSCRLVNTYGPTEATVVSTVCDLTANAESDATLGHPVFNVQAYVLDKHLNPVPVGAAGELHIGGAGLARGYLNRPQLTALKFIPNPFSDQPGARLYKTGDLARYLSDGSIELLGRANHQVKIRGFCISPGEQKHSRKVTARGHEATIEHSPSAGKGAISLSRFNAMPRQR